MSQPNMHSRFFIGWAHLNQWIFTIVTMRQVQRLYAILCIDAKNLFVVDPGLLMAMVITTYPYGFICENVFINIFYKCIYTHVERSIVQ